MSFITVPSTEADGLFSARDLGGVLAPQLSGPATLDQAAEVVELPQGRAHLGVFWDALVELRRFVREHSARLLPRIGTLSSNVARLLVRACAQRRQTTARLRQFLDYPAERGGDQQVTSRNRRVR